MRRTTEAQLEAGDGVMQRNGVALLTAAWRGLVGHGGVRARVRQGALQLSVIGCNTAGRKLSYCVLVCMWCMLVCALCFLGECMYSVGRIACR